MKPVPFKYVSPRKKIIIQIGSYKREDAGMFNSLFLDLDCE